VSLLGGKSVEIPIYDFSIHNRRNQRQFVKPCRIIVIEGILTLYFESLRKLMNIKVFVDTPDNIRFTRRISRDVKERGRTIKSVTNQYEKTVKPMYDQFVKPSRDLADIIITDGVQNKEAIDALMYNINVLL
jgi:uridine kinase